MKYGSNRSLLHIQHDTRNTQKKSFYKIRLIHMFFGIMCAFFTFLLDARNILTNQNNSNNNIKIAFFFSQHIIVHLHCLANCIWVENGVKTTRKKVFGMVLVLALRLHRNDIVYTNYKYFTSFALISSCSQACLIRLESSVCCVFFILSDFASVVEPTQSALS